MRTRFYFLLSCLFVALLAGWAFGSRALAMGDYSKLVIPQVKYRGGSFKPRAEALESLLVQVANRTSVEVRRASLDLDLKNPDLFRYPMIYMGGNDVFQSFAPEELNALRNYLSYGGFLLVDDNSATAHSKFDASFRNMVSQLFPHTPLQRLPEDHSIYRSFYLVNQVTGRVTVNPFLEGITVKGRTVLVYTANDLGGAWSRDKLGHWDYDAVGGDQQRKMAIRLGVNIVMYALTLDYKKDMVHLPIILERLRRSQAQ